jgi:RNA polymerase sigma-70 factor, ECF subfamily
MLFRRRPPADPPNARESGRDHATSDFSEEALAHIDALYGTAMRLTGRSADAEDLVQDTYVKAFRFQDRFERGTNLKAWLFTILHNTWRNARRASARDPVAIDSEAVDRAADTAGADDSPEARLSRRTLDANLRAALDALPDVFRQAVWLRDGEDFSYAEIATMLGVPIGTVMSRISRGRRLLYERLTGTGLRRAETASAAQAGRPALKEVGRSA